MGIKNTVFFLDLKTLSSKPDSKLKTFAKSEDLEVEDIIKIIYAEAERTRGPVTPKSVNIISPSSEKTGFFLPSK